MNVTIKPLTVELLDDYLYYFDNIAFTDNAHWSGCYCVYYHHDSDNAQWMKRTKEDNRNYAISLINEGKLTGYLAFCDGAPIGWCNVNDKSNYERLLASDELWDTKAVKTCSIVCFIVAPQYRGKGIASTILNKICSDYAEKGYEYIEAYPVKGDLSNAQQYHGPFSMYSKAGFTVEKDIDRFYIVRKSLK